MIGGRLRQWWRDIAETDARGLALRLWHLGWMTGVWVLLWGTISWANVLAGAAVALGVSIMLPLPRVDVEGRIHLWSLLKLIALFLVLLVQSSVQLVRLALRPGPPVQSAVLRAKVEIRSDLVLTLMVDFLNLIPGTMVLEIDQQRRLLYVHVLDVGSESAVRSFYRETALVERLFVSAFERPAEWHASPHHEPSIIEEKS